MIRPDAQDVNKMLNFETDDETDADSIFSRQTSRDDRLDFDDEDEGDGFDGGVGRNEDGRNKGVARGIMGDCRLTCVYLDSLCIVLTGTDTPLCISVI